MTNREYQQQIDDFEAHYQYDCTYMRELLEFSPDGYAKFAAFLPLSGHRERLSKEVYWVSKLAAMKAADCATCLQLNMRMALEEGVSKTIVNSAINGGEDLPAHLLNVLTFSSKIASNATLNEELLARIKEQFDKGDLLELGICIATTSIFPTIKKAIGYTKSTGNLAITV